MTNCITSVDRIRFLGECDNVLQIPPTSRLLTGCEMILLRRKQAADGDTTDGPCYAGDEESYCISDNAGNKLAGHVSCRLPRIRTNLT